MKFGETSRVVVTGLGVVTPIGIGKQVFWDSLISGKNGIGLITLFDTTGFHTTIAGEVKDFIPADHMDLKLARRSVRFIQLAVAATGLALKDASLKVSDTDNADKGVIIGSGVGGLSFLEEQHKIFLEKGPSRISPSTIPLMINDMASGQVAITFGLKGPNSCVTTACASGANAIGDAFKILQRGDAQVIVAGGAEAPVTPFFTDGFYVGGAVTGRNDDPERASRPFDRDRDGVVISEGAGIVIMETLEHALKRGARIYAEIAGYGMSGDAYHVTAPDPNGGGAARAMVHALKDAEVNREEIDYINAHGTSTPLNDKVETIAIKRVFGEHANKLPVSSNKSMIGHTMGAAGAIECIASILTVSHNLIPPTINYEFTDPDCDLDYVPNQAREANVQLTMTNSFGFGGHNAVLIVKQFVPV